MNKNKIILFVGIVCCILINNGIVMSATNKRLRVTRGTLYHINRKLKLTGSLYDYKVFYSYRKASKLIEKEGYIDPEDYNTIVNSDNKKKTKSQSSSSVVINVTFPDVSASANMNILPEDHLSPRIIEINEDQLNVFIPEHNNLPHLNDQKLVEEYRSISQDENENNINVDNSPPMQHLYINAAHRPLSQSSLNCDSLESNPLISSRAPERQNLTEAPQDMQNLHNLKNENNGSPIIEEVDPVDGVYQSDNNALNQKAKSPSTPLCVNNSTPLFSEEPIVNTPQRWLSKKSIIYTVVGCITVGTVIKLLLNHQKYQR